MSRAHDLAWCSGFFDGEGYVTIQERRSIVSGKTYRGHYLRVGINHVAIEPLIEIQRILGGTIRQQSAHSIVGNRKQRHSWQLSCSQAKEGLIQMMPYLRNKQTVAALGIELQNTMDKRSRVSEEVLEKRIKLKQQISELNAKD